MRGRTTVSTFHTARPRYNQVNQFLAKRTLPPKKDENINRRSVFLRDDFRCQYCGNQRDLTVSMAKLFPSHTEKATAEGAPRALTGRAAVCGSNGSIMNHATDQMNHTRAH